MLTSTATIPLYDKLTNQYNRHPIIITTLLTFLLSSILYRLTQNMTKLIIFHTIQSLKTNSFMPLTQIIINNIIPPAKQSKRQNIMPIVYTITNILNPMLNGVITNALS